MIFILFKKIYFIIDELLPDFNLELFNNLNYNFRNLQNFYNNLKKFKKIGQK